MHGPQGLADLLFLAGVGDLRDGGPRRTVGQSRKYLERLNGTFAKVGLGKLLISLAGVNPLHGHHLSHGCVSSSMVLRRTLLSPACKKTASRCDYHLVFSSV